MSDLADGVSIGRELETLGRRVGQAEVDLLEHAHDSPEMEAIRADLESIRERIVALEAAHHVHEEEEEGDPEPEPEPETPSEPETPPTRPHTLHRRLGGGRD